MSNNRPERLTPLVSHLVNLESVGEKEIEAMRRAVHARELGE